MNPAPELLLGQEHEEALDLAWSHGKKLLGPIQSLDLALLVDAEHERALGRVEVKADDVSNLLHEQRVR